MDEGVWRVITDYVDRLDPDPGHAGQVCTLSLLLYDCMQDLHGFEKTARDLLKAGAFLHDIGWSIPEKSHHKASCDLILADTKMPLTTDERKIIALIARYHRKSPPRQGHAVYSELAPVDQRIVRFCSGIVRIADSLDREHRAVVKTLTCQITPDEITIICSCIDSGRFDQMVFIEKSQLLEEITNRRICLICN